MKYLIAVPCVTLHNITHTFTCGAPHSLLSSACSPGRSWYPYHTQLLQSHLDFLLRMAAYSREGGEKKEEKKDFLSREESATLSQTIENLLLKTQIERLNPVPPHFRNPRQQVSWIHSVSNNSSAYCSAHKTRLPSCKHSMLMLQEHHQIAKTFMGRFIHNLSNLCSNFSNRHCIFGPSFSSLLTDCSAHACSLPSCMHRAMT